MNQEWPGNVRQLRNQIEKMVVLSDSKEIGTVNADFQQPSPISSEPRAPTLSSIQKEFLMKALEENHGNISKTAAQLGVARSTIYNKLKKYRKDPSNADP